MLFKNYYLSLILFALVPISFVIHPALGGVIFLIILYWYGYEKRVINKSIGELESECHREIKSIISNLSSLNLNIIDFLDWEHTDTERVQEITIKNIKYLEEIIESLRKILTNTHKINHLVKNSGFLFAKSLEYSYISNFYCLIYNLDVFEFHHKYKDLKNNIDIEKYRDDWLQLYARYHLVS